MNSTQELSPLLKEIATNVQKLIASPVGQNFDDFSKLEYQTYIEKNEPIIKEELSKITDIKLINKFVQDVPAHNLSLDVFPEFVWNEISFAENIYMSTEAYTKFTEKVRATPHIISETINSNDGINSVLEQFIPQKSLASEYQMEVLIGKHDQLIPLSAQELWNDKDFVEKMLFDEDVPNRQSIDEYSYIDILKRVPSSIIDEELALRIAEKFQLGYSQLPGEFKLKPDFAIVGLQKHIANIEAIPPETLENKEVVLAAVKATTILDRFQPHPYDSYHPIGHLEKLYSSSTFKKLNTYEIEPYRIPGHSQEFIEIFQKEYDLQFKKELVVEAPKPTPPEHIQANTHKSSFKGA